MKRIKTKIQVFNQDASAFGPGKAQLLRAILELGSISAAAKTMKMSYKRAWDLVAEMNEAFQEPLVVTKIGGNHGGGAEVTPFGRQILSVYQHAVKNAEAYIDAQLSDFIKFLK
jgi:molybdate transport system regulatory protein